MVLFLSAKKAKRAKCDLLRNYLFFGETGTRKE
jgi:hypothetical protein